MPPYGHSFFIKKYLQKIIKRYFLELGKEGIGSTEEGSAEINNIVEKITKEEENFDKAFHNSQKDFADKNKMKLMDNNVQKEIDKIKDQ